MTKYSITIKELEIKKMWTPLLQVELLSQKSL